MLAFGTNFWVIFPALILAITVHEAMHAYTAFKMGDDTPLREGRVTLNPLRHLSFLGTVMILFAPIGWGKPVVYNPMHFRNYKWGTILTAAAGPFANFLLAFVTAIPINNMAGFLGQHLYLATFLEFLFQINILLLVFNLLPIPPLDGSKVIMAIIPDKHHYRYERWMADGGLKYFLAIFIVDWFLSGFLGVSILGTVLNFMAMPFVALINLGV